MYCVIMNIEQYYNYLSILISYTCFKNLKYDEIKYYMYKCKKLYVYIVIVFHYIY